MVGILCEVDLKDPIRRTQGGVGLEYYGRRIVCGVGLGDLGWREDCGVGLQDHGLRTVIKCGFISMN